MRILLAVDGSNHSYEAARTLAQLSPIDALTVLHVVDIPRMEYPTHEETYFSDRLEGRMREEGHRLLNHVSSIFPGDMDSVQTHIANGTPAETIVAAAEKKQVDLIVLGARGLGPINEHIVGSVSHSVITYATCPTLVVRKPMKTLQHVLLAVQGPDDAEAAVQLFAKKPFRDAVQVTVFTVPPVHRPIWPLEPPISEQHIDKALHAARDFVNGIASQLSAMGCRAEGVVSMGVPWAAIIQQASETKADLILMGTHGKHGISRFALGSVSHTVLHKSPCSVLVIRLGAA